jgi:Holliday junction resolvase
MVYKAKRVDSNQVEITNALRSAGWKVTVVSDCSKLGYDLVAIKEGKLRLIEIKDGSKPPSARALTKNEVDAKENYPDHWVCVNSVDEALSL